jgi:small conductance mechanosensitive channel
MDSNVGQQVMDFITIYGLKVIGAIVILIIGRMVAGWLRRMIRKTMTSRGVDAALVGFVSSIVYALVMIFVILAALSKFGVQTASFVAILGAAGFAVGFALQGSLSNFASGVMLLLFRPFKVGDFIDAAGVAGTVKDIKLFTTIIATGDNVQILVPNGQIYGGTIKNFSANDTRRVDLVIGIGYDSPIDKSMELLLGLMKSPPPWSR